MRKLFIYIWGTAALFGSVLYATLFKKMTSEVAPATLGILAFISVVTLWFFPKAIACIVVVIGVKLFVDIVFDETMYEDAQVEL